jgi:hypothetical protein
MAALDDLDAEDFFELPLPVVVGARENAWQAFRK